MLSAAGVPRALLYAAGQAGALTGARSRRAGFRRRWWMRRWGGWPESSLLTFSVDGGTVTAHRLVMRVIRERLARQGHLAAACQAAAAVLDARAGSLERMAGPSGPPGSGPEQVTGGARARGRFSGDWTASDLTRPSCSCAGGRSDS